VRGAQQNLTASWMIRGVGEDPLPFVHVLFVGVVSQQFCGCVERLNNFYIRFMRVIRKKGGSRKAIGMRKEVAVIGWQHDAKKARDSP